MKDQPRAKRPYAEDADEEGLYHHGGVPGRSSRAHRDYADVVTATDVQRSAGAAPPPHAGSQPMPNYPDAFGGLLGDLRPRLEHSLGHDLSGVRIHTGADAQAGATALGARAYTRGQDIYFGAGQYNPSSRDGQHLIAHEVAHTVQQRGVSAPAAQCKADLFSGALTQPGDAYEAEADRFADAFVSNARATVTAGSAPAGAIARKAKGGGARPAFIIASAWDANGKRLEIWHGPSTWSGRFRVYNGRARSGRVAWLGARVDHPVQLGGQALTDWLPAEATRVVLSVGADYGMLDTSVHQPGAGRHRDGRRKRHHRTTHKRQITNPYREHDRKTRRQHQATVRKRAAMTEQRFVESRLYQGHMPGDILVDTSETVVDYVAEHAKTYETGVVIGVFDGAYASLEGMYEMAKDALVWAAKTIVRLLKGEGAQVVFELATALGKLVLNAPKILRAVARDMYPKLTQPDDFERGKYHGYIAGYIVTELAFLFATMGAGAELEAGKFARLLNVMRTVSEATDPVAWAGKLARRIEETEDAAKYLHKAHVEMGGRKNTGAPHVDPALGTREPRAFVKRRKLLSSRKIHRHERWESAARALKTSKGEAIGRRLKKEADGQLILSGLASGDHSVLKMIGIDDYPRHLDTTGREWALVQTKDGYVIYAGHYDGIHLPNDARTIAHTHPGPNRSASFLDAEHSEALAVELPHTGNKGMTYDEVLAMHNAERTGLTPSAADIHGTSDGAAHTIHTRFVHRGNGRIDNPLPNDPSPRVAIHMENTKVLRWNPRTKAYWYETEITVKDTTGAELWRGKMYNKWHAQMKERTPVHKKKPAELKRPPSNGFREP